MHSRVIVLNDYISEETLFEAMEGVADYVVELDDLSEVQEYLKDFGTVEGTHFEVDLNKVKEYLENEYKYFQALVKDLSFEDYANNYKSYIIKSAMDDKFGLYFYTDYAWLTTKQYFFKMVYSADDDKLLNWEITQLFDYHC